MNENREKLLEERVREFEVICRESGLKVTHQRQEIFREIALDSTHPSAEELYMRVKDRIPAISLDTIYRTLATFERCGILSRIHDLDGRGRYDPNLDHHHHFICLECGGIQDFYWPGFDEITPPFEVSTWGKVMNQRVEMQGICKRCLAKHKKE
jgi:Fur family peroxide stress response transcriptional regulator